MIISHEHKFIFIKTHKTAGSSIETALAPFCSKNDIITPMESNAHTDIPRHYHGQNWLDKLYAQSRLTRKCIHRHSPYLKCWYYEHMPAWRVKALIGEETWNQYYTFCFERNPWDKVVSYYLWKKYGQKRRMPDFKSYVMNKSYRLPQDARLYMNDNDLLVDQIYDFHQLSNTFSQLCTKLNLPSTTPLSREKTGIKIDRLSYTDYYDDESRQKVADLYSREIALLNFSFAQYASR